MSKYATSTIICPAIAAVLIVSTMLVLTWYTAIRPEPNIPTARHKVEQIYDGNAAAIRLQHPGYIPANIASTTKVLQRELTSFNSHFYNLAAERRWVLPNGQLPHKHQHKIIMPAEDLKLLRQVAQNPHQWAGKEMTREFKHQPTVNEDQLVIASLTITTNHRSHALAVFVGILSAVSFIAVTVATINAVYVHRLKHAPPTPNEA